MNPLVMETDIGRDADDLFALLYFLGIEAPLKAICVSPGDHDQVAIVRAVLHAFGRNEVKVLTPKARVPKESVSPYHKWVIGQLGGKLLSEPDGHEESLPTDPVEVFICGPAKMAHLLKPLSITMQGGFVPYSRYRPRKTLDKFEGKETCATFNLGGTKPKVVETLLMANCPHRWVGKNVCHTVVYTPKVHESFCLKAKGSEPEALRLHRLFVEKYIEEKGAKAFHDPLAAMLHYNPDVGIWADLKPERINGEYTAVEAAPNFHQSLVDLKPETPSLWLPDTGKTDIQPWTRYFEGLSGARAITQAEIVDMVANGQFGVLSNGQIIVDGFWVTEMAPRADEHVHGCQHGLACGAVKEVVSGPHPAEDPKNPHTFVVVENFHGRTITVRREEDGCLYEVFYRPTDG